MASIEDRIVKIQFDNGGFERKLADTMASISKLNSTLATAGSKSGLDNLKTSANNFNLSGIGASIDGISGKFLAMSTIAITALSTIVSKAISAGAQIASALTIDPVTAGFQEYELQIGSIQTILANTDAKGTSLEQVNTALDELNEYSDKTIYNFGQMTKNIGTFTAAGVDLDTSVSSIKGIANLAAISGSSSEQASTAMYQLSQAMASGTVKLMDWNSVVNAGMGGEIFQKALFETGKMMGTIADVPMDQTFEEWTDAGNTFRGSLETGWLTADVLTTTLGGFTGEMSEAQLMAQGFTQDQAREMMRLGEIGVEAATKVRTLTGLFQTSKEAMQSGWAQSFELIFGDFEEATELFSGISDALGGMIGKSADARNATLSLWKSMGGRDKLIQGLTTAFQAMGEIMAPIKEAFRDIFPRKTSGDLYRMTKQFADLMERMRPSGETVENLKRIFTGFFSALKIGWTILKEGVGFIVNLVRSLTGLGGGGFLSKLATIGDFFTNLRTGMVDEGGIAAFFDNLTESVQKPIEWINKLKTAIAGLFDNLEMPSGLQGMLNSMGGIFSGLLGGLSGGLSGAGDILGGAGGAAGGIWGSLQSAMGGLGDIFSNALSAIGDFFGNIGSHIADAMGVPDFSNVMEVLDTALLSGILALLYKFSKGGLLDDFGGGIFKNISSAFGELTGTLQAMQTDLKANAIMKIAIAIGILAASLLILSTIDPERLSDSMAALALTFGQLMGAFALLNKMTLNIASAATLVLIAGGMVIMAGAVLLLVAAVKLFSMMSWEDMAKGLAGVAASLGLLVGAVLLLNFAKGGMISTGIGMLFLATSLIIMAGAVKLFSMMDWGELAKGLTGVAGALIAIAIGAKLMGPSLILIGPGLVAVAFALNIIAGAMMLMASMSWEDIGKGLVGMAGALAAIAATTSFMSPWLPLIGVGLIAVGIGLSSIAGVMVILGNMEWGEIARGLVGISGALFAIATAMVIANSGALGAAGLIAMAFGLTILVGVITTMGALSWGTIIKGVAGIAIALVALAGVAYLLSGAVVPLLGIGLALALIGAGFALFGVGIMSVAKGLELLIKLGPKAIEALVDAVKAFGEVLPDLMSSVAEGLMEFLDTLLSGMPEIIDKLVEVLSSLLDGLVELIPKAADAIGTLIEELLSVIRAHFPALVETGFQMIMNLLEGIQNNIGPITTAVAQILINFMDALALQLPALIDSFYNLLVAVFKGVVAKLGEIGSILLPKGIELLKGLWEGAKQAVPAFLGWLGSLPGKLIAALPGFLSFLLQKGRDLIQGLWEGAQEWWDTTALPWFEDLPQLIRTAIGGLLKLLRDIGGNVIAGLKAGAEVVWDKAVEWFKSIPQLIRTAIGKLLTLLRDIGGNVIAGLKDGAVVVWNKAVTWFKSIPQLIRTAIGSLLTLLRDIGGNVIAGLKSGAEATWGRLRSWFSGIGQLIRTAIGSLISLLKDIGGNVIIGLYNAAFAKWNSIRSWFSGTGQRIRTAIGSLGGLLRDIGANILQSLYDGARDKWSRVAGWFADVGSTIKDIVTGILGIGSPSTYFMHYGEMTMRGLQIGLEDEWDYVAKWLHDLNPVDELDSNMASKMSAVVSGIADQLSNMDEFQPVITPVLDLTQVQNDAALLAGMLPANASYLQAANIARSAQPGVTDTPIAPNTQGDVKFEQNIYAPEQLSTADIYRQTRNQIAIAKEELKI